MFRELQKDAQILGYHVFLFQELNNYIFTDFTEHFWRPQIIVCRTYFSLLFEIRTFFLCSACFVLHLPHPFTFLKHGGLAQDHRCSFPQNTEMHHPALSLLLHNPEPSTSSWTIILHPLLPWSIAPKVRCSFMLTCLIAFWALNIPTELLGSLASDLFFPYYMWTF